MCDTFASFGPDGALFAKNSDRPRNEPQVLRWHPARTADKTLTTQYLNIPDHDAYGVLLSQPTWLWGAEHGINEHGVAIGNERLFSARDHGDEAALIGMDLVRLGLERGSTADEAVDAMTDLLATHGQGGSGQETAHEPYDSSFLIADANGGWIVETFGSEWVAAPLRRHGAISNRHSLGASWTRSSARVPAGQSTLEWHSERVDIRGADNRLRATAACAMANDSLDATIAIATLRDHGTGPWGRPGHEGAVVPPPSELGEHMTGVTVCMHGETISTTTASMVARLWPDRKPPEVWACLGSPCVGEYVAVDLAAVPPNLSNEARWRDAAATRDLVEAEPAVLAGVRAEVAMREAVTFA